MKESTVSNGDFRAPNGVFGIPITYEKGGFRVINKNI